MSAEKIDPLYRPTREPAATSSMFKLQHAVQFALKTHPTKERSPLLDQKDETYNVD